MPETYMTVIGNVCDDPKRRVTKTGHSVTNFRVASTPRRFNREEGRWVDLPTLFVNVTCWRTVADNVDTSVRKGQPVVVTGRFYCRPYELNESVRIGYELEATAVGHDLTRGVADFRKNLRPVAVTDVEADADGMPVDDSAHWLDVPDAPTAPGDTAPELASVS
jgi:single-strand DNA-binding protein